MEVTGKVAEEGRPMSASPKKHLLWGLLAGLVFYSVFWMGYRSIDEDLFRNRDDGIITVSHARNWVDFGSIGVNPSGERVEGFSSPLQFLLFAGAYKATGIHYDLYFRLVTSATALLIGGLIFWLCLPYRLGGVLLGGVAALALVRDFSFFEWHASGMENALTHATFLLAVVLLVRMYVRQRIVLLYAPLIFAASIARIESIYHVAPLLVLFAFCWLWQYGQGRGIVFAGFVMMLWGVFFAVRGHYFGALFPNTAAAQGISIGDRIGFLFDGNARYLARSWDLTGTLFRWHHGFLLFPIVACLPFLHYTRKTVLSAFLLLSLAATGLFSPFLFGPARLDVTRLSTQVALALVALSVLVALHTRRPRFRYATIPVLLVSLSTLLYVGHTRWEHSPYYLWFSEKVFAEYREKLVALRETHDIPRPTVANPDLGLMSWHKDVNIVDLGYLGNPALTALDGIPSNTKREVANYFFEIAAPDLIEMHGIWSERHAHLFKDRRFRERYVAEASEIDGFLQKRFNRSATFKAEYGAYVRTGYWVRRDMMADSGSRERALVDSLRTAPTLARLDEELAWCKAESLPPEACFYVVRSAYRFIPEFVAQGNYEKLVSLFERDAKALGYTTALLKGRLQADWSEEVVDYLTAYSPERVGRQMAADFEETFATERVTHLTAAETIAPGLRLEHVALSPAGDGWAKLQLHFVVSAPITVDWKIYTHGVVDPERRSVLPAAEQGRAFLNWDIGFPDPPTREWHRYSEVIVTQYVPHADAVHALRVGLYLPGKGALGTGVEVSLSSAEES